MSFGIVIAIAVTSAGDPPLSFSPWTFMWGAAYFNRHTALLVGPIPWANIAAYVLLAAFLIAVSVKVIEKREF